tara:strand:- start:2043 stop:2387 length:345 start_codon:yes stop_codon:yes gene_type:complete
MPNMPNMQNNKIFILSNKMNLDKFYKMCTPAQVYFVVSALGAVIALLNNVPIVAIVLKFIFIMIWTYVLAYLCNKGYANASWFLVLLPFIMMVLAMLGGRSPMVSQIMYKMKMY